MIGHVSLGVKDMERSARFYDSVLAALGYARLWTGEAGLGYGKAGGGEALNLFAHRDATAPGPGFHLAFVAPDWTAVDRFHFNALRAGGIDEGGPGLRPAYGSAYYAAFVRDPDGHKLEAVHQ